MINQTLLSLYTVLVLLAPVNILSFSSDETVNVKANFENTWEQKNQTVTTLETSRVASAETEITTEEKQMEQLEKWLQDLPVYEEETPQAEFIQTIAPAAILIANANDIYPSVMIAQASLESSWGQSGLAQDFNNLMGTKGSWNGESVTVRTREDVGGESVYINAGFSVYDSWIDSLYRYGLLMSQGLEWDANFYKGTWRTNTESYKDATAYLQGRYATDSTYADKLNATIQSFNLNQFDNIEPLDIELDEVLEQLTI